MDDLNHMNKMLKKVREIIEHHKDPSINISEVEPKYIKECFKDIEYITDKLGSIIQQLKIIKNK